MLSFTALREQVKREVTKIDAGYRVSYFETYSGQTDFSPQRTLKGAKEKQRTKAKYLPLISADERRSKPVKKGLTSRPTHRASRHCRAAPSWPVPGHAHG